MIIKNHKYKYLAKSKRKLAMLHPFPLAFTKNYVKINQL